MMPFCINRISRFTLMQSCNNPSSPWTVSVPLSALLELEQLPGMVSSLQTELSQLRRELEALRGIQTQTLERIADIKRSL